MTRLLGTWILRLAGWRVKGQVPGSPRLVAVVAPHTSNWDFFWLLLAKWQLALHPRWLGKHTLFQGPLGWFMRQIGGIPVDRSRRADVVGQAAAHFDHDQSMILALAPEGTRRHTEYWRSGFYEIARRAKVPLLPVSIDYDARRIELGAPIELCGDRSTDMANLAAFYRGKRGRNPEMQGPVRLADS